MRLLTVEVPRNFNIFLVSCTHWGSPFHHLNGWYKLCDMVNEPYAGLPASANYVIHHGDAVDSKPIDSPHWSLLGVEPGGIIPQMSKGKAMLFPIRKKIITLLQGNHEQNLEAKYGNITAWICNELDIPYGTFSSVITYRSKHDGALLFKHYVTHGHVGIASSADDIIRRRSNMRLALKRQLGPMFADTYLMSKGHTHKMIISPPEPDLYLTSDDKEGAIHQNYTGSAQTASYIHPDLRWYVNVGAFFRMFGDDVVNHDYNKPTEGVRSSYAEVAEYHPIELGFAVALVRDGILKEVRLEVMA